MEREMIVTRHRAREEQGDSCHEIELESNRSERHNESERYTECERVNERERQNESEKSYEERQRNSASSTLLEHQSPNYLHMSRGDQNSSVQNTEINKSIINIEAKVASLENSLINVTHELTNALKNLNTQTHPHESRAKTRNTQNNRIRDGSNSESDTDSDNIHLSPPASVVRRHKNSPKLPPFTGKESWNVWFNRFEDVASRQNWSSDEKLDEILPRLQGPAGDFVYGQLTHESRSHYRTLCKELSNRFRVVETSKTFWVQFSHRNQKSGETVEEYAAELKQLYDKAHAKRDKQTRQEDLLRRFLDGLNDDKARFHVEFIKEPKDIDEAVFYTVCFQETRQKSSDQRARSVFENDSSESENEIARMVPIKNKHKVISKDDSPSQKAESNDLEKLREIVREELKAINIAQNTSPQTQNGYYGNRNTNHYKTNYSNNQTKRACFWCNDPGHFKRDCPRYQEQTALNQNKSQQWSGNRSNYMGNGNAPRYQNFEHKRVSWDQSQVQGHSQGSTQQANTDSNHQNLNC